MIQLDPILAVNDVNASSDWYQQVFGFRRVHGGDEFAVLVDEKGEVILCLHKWGEHEHPTMISPEITPGNGLILYFRTDEMDHILDNVRKKGIVVEEEIHLNPNSEKMEFSLRDPDGYFLTITQFHRYGS